MNQSNSFQLSNLWFTKLRRLSHAAILQSLAGYRKTHTASLLGLSSRLKHWNDQRIVKLKTEGQPQNLTLEDVDFLKGMIQVAIGKASMRYPEVMADQLLFLTVGAIQVQTQTNSDRAWQLVNQSIQSYLNSQKDKRLFLFGLVTVITIICLSTISTTNSRLHAINSESEVLPIETETVSDATDPVTISMLLLAYKKMKAGTCQLPQAAMLPPAQRQAFLLFVNKGTINVEQVENLRLALDYVNCLYPQELMHPVSTSGNRL